MSQFNEIPFLLLFCSHFSQKQQCSLRLPFALKLFQVRFSTDVLISLTFWYTVWYPTSLGSKWMEPQVQCKDLCLGSGPSSEMVDQGGCSERQHPDCHAGLSRERQQKGKGREELGTIPGSDEKGSCRAHRMQRPGEHGRSH